MAATAVEVTKFTTEFASLMHVINPDISADAINYDYRGSYVVPNYMTLKSSLGVNSILVATDGQVSKYHAGAYQKVEGLTEEQEQTASTIASLFQTSDDFFAIINRQFFPNQTKTIGKITLKKEEKVSICLYESTTDTSNPISGVIAKFAAANLDLGLQVSSTKSKVTIVLPKRSISEHQEKISQLVTNYQEFYLSNLPESKRASEEDCLVAERKSQLDEKRRLDAERRVAEQTRRNEEVAGLATAAKAFNQLAKDLVREEASNHPVITELSRQFTEALADYKTLKTDKAGFQAAMESAFTYAQDNETAINQNRHLKQALLNIAICLTFPISLPIIGVCALATGKSFASFFRSEPTAAEQKRDDVKTQFDHVYRPAAITPSVG